MLYADTLIVTGFNVSRKTKTGTIAKPASESNYDSDNVTHEFNKKTTIEIGDEFVKILQDNAFNGIYGGDVIDHIAKVLEILEWIKIPDVDKDQLRLHIFPISLSGRAKECDGTLQMVRDNMHDMMHSFVLGYNDAMLNRKWLEKDQQRTDEMLKLIDNMLLERRIMRSLKCYVGGRLNETDYRLRMRTI
ncbi:hypothetical protein Tco_0133488 [Tanacetum coccineum]